MTGARIAVIAALACWVAGCSGPPALWTAETVPVVTARAEASSAPCPAIDQAIASESRRVTPIGALQDADALTAALMGSEAAKNASLARLASAYENCRRRAAK